MREAFYNVFFSKIKNVYQAFAYQKLKEYLGSNSKIKVKCVDACNAKKHSKINSQYQVSANKKMYVDVISNFALDYPSETRQDVLVTRMRAIGMVPSIVYNNIVLVCEDTGYQNSNLYYNIIKARKELI